ncbi:TPA: hypothetical protein JBC15_07425 [Legionella pneumophila subsp. pneumophila]|nr:hypothetical protein [Legionella pneumophila subsp. pneumophila]HAT9260930.1 hypothetical protein [Legionella pneumophila subsp. pneumophila]HAT9282426.1 hypothetical protein [Legionella pneumophila subsp. pneumophila]HAT9288362.1 hypothetical protein [Legionella pneumophila subsp. pneumophila]HAT9307539.1 hypothetical protein [Legionella pneumophila subsp. pneumophila]
MAQAQAIRDNQAPEALDYQGTPKVVQGTLMAPLDTQLAVLVFQCYLSYHPFIAILFKIIANALNSFLTKSKYY